MRAQEQENVTPISGHKNVVIEQILGRITVDGCTPGGVPQANNTRWVFEVTGGAGKDLVIGFIDYETGRPVVPDIIGGPTLAAFSPGFYDARVFCIVNADGTITLKSSETSELCRYRVTVDTMHSSHR